MRLIRKLVVLAIIGGGGVAAYNYWSDHGWPLRSRATTLDSADLKRKAVTLATRASAMASVAASQVGVTMSEGALTAKIKSKMALDDHVNARAVDVDTSGSVVTLAGVVGSAAARERAVSLARDTEGVTRVVDRLQVRQR
jgi:hyperosmotically inducible protein